ncbi:MAG: alpha/beta hydrolase [Proteobacteria bacterium]|nr:alpha/beta hydrolase [Pseudomonadota bacterium]
MLEQKRTFVILHGGWQSSRGWKAVADLLNQAGFRVGLVDLPGHGSQAGIPFHKINLQTYVNYTCQIVQEFQKQGPVVLVGHSMSGMVISQVAQNMMVDRLIYVTAFLPVNHERLVDIARHSPIIGISKNMVYNLKEKSISLDKAGLDRLFYNGCSFEVTEQALSRLQEQPVLPFYGRVYLTKEKFGAVPKYYVECTKDFSLSIKLQRSMQKRWPCGIYSVEAGHCPFYSIPEVLTEIFINCISTK